MNKAEELPDTVYVRELLVQDASENYVHWLEDSATNQFLETKSATISELQDYISHHRRKSDSLLLGVFTSADDVHIGNIKFEPIHLESGAAELGVMIGSSAHRGRGLGGMAIRAGTLELLARHPEVRRITLGVRHDNLPAIRAYRKLGFNKMDESEFQEVSNPPSGTLRFEIATHLLIH